MGRDVTGIHTDKKPNPVKLKPESTVSQEKAHLSPKISGLRLEEKGYETDPVVNDSTIAENQHKLDIENKKTDLKIDINMVKKMDAPVKGDGKPVDSVLQPRDVDSDPMAPTGTLDSRGESTDSTEKSSNKIKNDDIPTDANESQPNSPIGTTKPLQSDCKKQVDEEGDISAASSAAASAKTSKFKTTVPVAPVFKCVARAEKRKQFYSKLEEKQAAMEAEKLENEARIKEKEQAVIRQLRKNLVFKANPMPRFYQEGPPPKTELKKFPVTRAKSPKLNRRKSCGDVMRGLTLDEKRKENQHTVRLS